MDLINLDSPTVKPKPDYNTNSPLIPAPRETMFTERPNNPFDEVVNVIELNQPRDPFDFVLQAALKRHDARTKTEAVPVEKRSVSECQSQSYGDVSPDVSYISDDIKGFVSQRLSSLIERTLSSSSLQNDFTSENKIYFKRSFSASVLPETFGSPKLSDDSLCSNCCSKFNSSLPVGQVNRLSNTEKKLSTTGDVSISRLADNFQGLSTEDSFEVTKDVLRKEAEKIRKIISSLQYNPDASQLDAKDSSEDLFDMSAPWIVRDIQLSDEEDSVGLPRVITYSRSFQSSLSNSQFRTQSTDQKQPLEESVIDKYLKKRNSLDLGQTEQSVEDTTIDDFTPEQIVASSSLMDDSITSVENVELEPLKLKEVTEDKKIEMPLVKDVINTETLRSKKKAGSEFSKRGGPMKAMMPLQKMSKHLTSKMSSPFKNRGSRSSKTVLKPETVNDSITIPPVASSTPTKSTELETSISSLRGRENNKMSPTGRKAAKRSASASKVDTKNESTVTKIVSASDISVSKVKKSATRPSSAPSGTDANKSSIKRNALKALLPAPMLKLRNSESKGLSRNKNQNSRSLKKDKENLLKK